jgi:4-azaleucine resistance transporter AzlC
VNTTLQPARWAAQIGVDTEVRRGGKYGVRVRDSFRTGFRLGIPYAVVSCVLSASFSVLAVQSGFTALQALATGVVVFAGSAQFAALGVLIGGGTPLAAVAAGTLMNGRFLAMGIAIAPSLPGGPLKRGAQGQAIVDASWALSNRGDGSYDRWLMFGNTLPQYVMWVVGAAVGAYGGSALGDVGRFGLDAVFPTFFLALLMAELRDRRSRTVALVGAVVALALVPFAPAGVPIMAAAVASLWGLRR